MTERRALRLLTAPFVVGSLVLVGLPGLISAGLAFLRYDALAPPVWAGTANFTELRAEPEFWHAVHNSVLFMALGVPLRLGLALTLAMTLQHRRRGASFTRAAVFLPTVIPDAALALIGLWLFNPIYGPLNAALRALGLPGPSWLTEPSLAKLPFVALWVMQIGEGLVVLLAALRSIPGEYLEAARQEGAGRRQSFRLVILPLLMPWLVLLAARDVIQSLPFTFSLSLLMTQGDPYYATLFLPLLTYEEAFDRLRFGMGGALTVLTLAFTALIVGALFAQFARRGYLDEA